MKNKNEDLTFTQIQAIFLRISSYGLMNNFRAIEKELSELTPEDKIQTYVSTLRSAYAYSNDVTNYQETIAKVSKYLTDRKKDPKDILYGLDKPYKPFTLD